MSLAAKKMANQGTQAQDPNRPIMRQLKKGDLVFTEGDLSKSMYFLKSGMIRIFKKKGNSSIEIDTIRSGQILGELAFLDGGPRSASGEALTDCTLIEIGAATFTQTLSKMPDWLILLLKTVVGRLRTASTKIKQLEQASTAFEYTAGKKGSNQHYVYLSTADILKTCTAIMLVSLLENESSDDGVGRKLSVSTLQRYGHNVLTVPVAKITSILDVFSQVNLIDLESSDDGRVILKDPKFLEGFIKYVTDENMLEPSKRHDMTLKGFKIMKVIAKHLGNYKPDPETDKAEVNLAEIMSKEKEESGKDPFRMEEFPELAKLGYCTQVDIRSNDEKITVVTPGEFMRNYRYQRVMKAIEAANEAKRSNPGR